MNMKQYITKPVIVEAIPAQELLDLVVNNQELPSVINNLFVDGRVAFGNGVVYVEGVEAHGNQWVVVEYESDPIIVRIVEDQRFNELFEDGEMKDPGPSTTGPKPEETTPAPSAPTPAPVEAPKPSAPVPAPPVTPAGSSGPENGGRTNYQAAQQGVDPSRHERPAQNLDELK